MAEVVAQQQSQPQHSENGSEYAFSSAAFRKKKKKKKIRAKKVITTEEAVSRRCRSNQESIRSQSTPALARTPRPPETPKTNHERSSATPQAKATSDLVTTPPSPLSSYKSPAVSVTLLSPDRKETSKTKSRGQQELEAELELSNHNRELRKPWETDIRKKKKTEYGDILLRDGPCSADRIQSRSAASHHLKFRRARSLSTTRHRSVSRHRSRSRSQRPTLNLFSDWYSSDSEDESNDETAEKELQLDESSFFRDEDITYEKYRQFLSGTKSTDEDETLSRQSVLSLKQKVGAAPSLEFSYRYSAAADELLNGDNDNLDDSCGTNRLESKCNTEATTNLTEPEDLSVRLQHEVETETEPHEFLGEITNDESDGSKSRDTTVFLGDVAFATDVHSDSENLEDPSNHQESSSVVEQEATVTPLPSPVSSPHPPCLTDSSSPIKYPPTPTSATTEELSLPPIPQPPLEKENEYNEEMPSPPRFPEETRQQEALQNQMEEEKLCAEKEELRLQTEAEERIREEEEEEGRLRKLEEIEGAERLRAEEEELRLDREGEERIREKEEQRLRQLEEIEAAERLRAEEEQKMRVKEELRQQREAEERIREEEEHRIRKAEELRLLRQLEERKKLEAEERMKEQKRLKVLEERQRQRRLEEEKKRKEEEERKKEQKRLQMLEEERRRKEEEEQQRQIELRRQMMLAKEKERKKEEERQRKIQEEQKRLQKEQENQQRRLEEENRRQREMVLQRRTEFVERADIEEVAPIQDLVDENDIDAGFEAAYMLDEKESNEECDAGVVEDTDEDPEYQEEDRMMLNMLYSIHMG